VTDADAVAKADQKGGPVLARWDPSAARILVTSLSNIG